MAKAKQKLWGGAFAGKTHPAVEAFGDSTHYEDRLVPHDIAGSVAHARMLARVRVISKAEAAKLEAGLKRILKEWEQGRFKLDPAYEDVHGNIEARLKELLGPVAGKLHSGRSRNDQIALDGRLILRQQITWLKAELGTATSAWLKFASAHQGHILPGYTHVQRGQPVLMGHWCLAFIEMWLRDLKRLDQVLETVNEECPLGAAALAGSTLPLDRAFVAKQLGFKRPTENSMDSVTNRDHVIDFAYAMAMLMQHLSRFGEELVLYCSQEFGFLKLGDAIATGSSLMPQKRNADVAELLRGRSGRAYGLLTQLLTVHKGLPLTYNRDQQEDKELAFQTFDMVLHCVRLLPVLAQNLTPDPQRMLAACKEGFLEATDAADYLVRKGIPFRQAHEAVGAAVRVAQDRGLTLSELELGAWQALHPAFGPDLFQALKLEQVVAARRTFGGTAPKNVKAALARAQKRLKAALR